MSSGIVLGFNSKSCPTWIFWERSFSCSWTNLPTRGWFQVLVFGGVKAWGQGTRECLLTTQPFLEDHPLLLLSLVKAMLRTLWLFLPSGNLALPWTIIQKRAPFLTVLDIVTSLFPKPRGIPFWFRSPFLPFTLQGSPSFPTDPHSLIHWATKQQIASRRKEDLVFQLSLKKASMIKNERKTE